MRKTLIILMFAFAAVSAVAETTPVPDPKISWVNQKLQDALSDTISKAVTVAGEAKDFILAELPDVIQQLLLWKFWEALLPMVFFGLLAAFMAWRISALIQAGDWTAVSEDGGYVHDPKNGYPKMIWGIAKAGIWLVVTILFVINLNLTWLQIWIAPKVYLIEYAKSIVTGR